MPITEIWTDGSYNKGNSGVVGWGYTVYIDDEPKEEDFGETENTGGNNVDGEIMAVLKALETCYNKGYFNPIIYHDYSGLAHWANDTWKAHKPLTQRFKEEVTKYKKLLHSVTFQYVASKSTAKQKRADRLAGTMGHHANSS